MEGSPRRSPLSVSYYDLWVKWRIIDPLRREGRTAEEIFEELKAQGYPVNYVRMMDGTPLNVKEISRLAGLRFSPPDEA